MDARTENADMCEGCGDREGRFYTDDDVLLCEPCYDDCIADLSTHTDDCPCGKCGATQPLAEEQL